MSRTYRHTSYNRLYIEFESEKDFDAAYKASKLDYSSWLKKKPVLPKLPAGANWMYCPESKEIYKKFREEYSSWEFSDIGKLYRQASRYAMCGFGCVSYDQYINTVKARAKKDGSYGPNYYRHAKGWVCNLYFERPMRRAIKRVLKECYAHDSYDDTVYPEWLKGAAWSYW